LGALKKAMPPGTINASRDHTATGLDRILAVPAATIRHPPDTTQGESTAADLGRTARYADRALLAGAGLLMEVLVNL
jgi:hypothetical protein